MYRIIFHFSLFYDAEMHRKLWSETATKEAKEFPSLLYIYKFFEKPNKEKCKIELNSSTAMLLYLFFDSSLSICPTTMETEEWLSTPLFLKCCVIEICNKRIVCLHQNVPLIQHSFTQFYELCGLFVSYSRAGNGYFRA